MSRSNDGLDPSSTTDAIGGSYGGSANRSNDGLDPSGTSDAYGGGGGSGGGLSNRANDGLDPSGTSDAVSRESTQRGGNPAYNDRTSGGLGYDDTMGDTQRTGGAERGGDQEKSRYTSGGLGENDTYGGEQDTGGADTGYDHDYGMGSGRTVAQEKGGPLPTEPGRIDDRGQDVDYDRASGGGQYDDDASGRGSNKDSTAGKLMEKAGGLFKNENLREKGEEKRRQAGEY